MGYLDDTIVAKSANDAEWFEFDALLQGWILSTVSDEVSDLVLANSPTAAALWKAIYKLFHDNKHARAMQLEHRFRTTVKGTKTINEYCHTLKNLADYLDDIDAPYQNPFPTFLEVRSALLLVEQQQADALPNAAQSTALLSFSGGGGSNMAGGGQSRPGSSGQNSGRGSFGGSNRVNSGGYRGRGRGRPPLHLQMDHVFPLCCPKKVVHINNTIPTHNPVQPPKPLVVKCVSNSDSLGPWTLAENQGREIRFRVAFDGMTVFTCDFTWGSKHHAVTVFDGLHDKCFDERHSYWQVRPMGFYFNCGEFPEDDKFILLGCFTPKISP
ncbi:unnamed protein product [Cuscuta campestris]|uniref:S-protein homolog n=1 Tax=Cuscuta campestris TaxID=132261 RepID=A0A484L142_9ASTE|nr:unnamed protein product [Cuscuta campestris]